MRIAWMLIALAGATGLRAANPRGPGGPPVPAGRPSVLLITLDTVRADHLGCYGAAGVSTPNLDALAARGVRFENGWASAPITLSSHATIMTGTFPIRHGARDNGLFKLAPGIETLAELYRKNGYRTAAFVSAAVLDRSFGLARGFDYYDDNVRVGELRAFAYQERAANQVTKAAVDYLPKLQADGRPFFLWIHYYDAHFPWVAPNPYKTMFRANPYDGEIAFIDENLGRLFEALKEAGLDRNLYIAAAGDHGESLGDHGEPNHGVFLYRAATRVPIIIAGPRIPTGYVAPDARLADLGPTLAWVTGAGELAQAQGQALHGCIGITKAMCPDPRLFQETYMPYFSYGFSPLMGLLEGRSHYISAPQPELYDLGEDPGETRNLLLDDPDGARAKEWAGKLAAALSEWSAPGAGKGLPAPNGDAPPELLRSLAQLGYVGNAGGAAQNLPDPKSVVDILPKLRQAEALDGQGRFKESIPVYEAVLRRVPGNFNTYGLLGNARMAMNQPAEALKVFRAGLKLNPKLDFLRMGEIRALAALQDPAAETRLRELVRDAPRNGDTWMALHEYLAERKRFPEARKALDGARAAGHDDAEIRYALGEDEYRRGRLAQAEAQFRKAVDFNEYHAEALARLGELTAKRDRTQAAGYYRRAIEERPDRADWKAALAALERR